MMAKLSVSGYGSPAVYAQRIKGATGGSFQ